MELKEQTLKKTVYKKEWDKNRIKDLIADILIYTIISAAALTCVLPFIHVMAKSLSEDKYVTQQIVYLIPKGFNVEAYKNIFGDASMMSSMYLTIFVTIMFTAIGMFVTICAAYPLTKKRLKGRYFFSFVFVFTMYFSGGIIPDYLLMNNLNLLNTVWVLILPLCFSAYNMIILKSFIQSSIPDSLEESAILDGASDLRILISIVLPLSKPILATLSLFYAVGRWNAYQDALYYLTRPKLYPLQLKLNQLVSAAGDTASIAQEMGGTMMTNPEVIKAACIMFATLPIICVYPFVQKYFVKGVMIGSVKG
jgi:putative aldouronate transport system permease protein